MNRAYKKRINDDCLNCLKQNLLTRDFTLITQKRMVDVLVPKQYLRNETVFEEGKSNSDYVYIVGNGEFLITKKIVIKISAGENQSILDYTAVNRYKLEQGEKVRSETVNLKIVGQNGIFGATDILFGTKY